MKLTDTHSDFEIDHPVHQIEVTAIPNLMA